MPVRRGNAARRSREFAFHESPRHDASRMSEPQHDHPHVIARNARFGMILFVVYVVFYGGFVALSAFAPGVMAEDVAGVNLAVVYGFALIIAAFVLALVYMFGATTSHADRAEDRA
jgi:uncharacterized membrane protein (DUF485 family)